MQFFFVHCNIKPQALVITVRPTHSPIARTVIVSTSYAQPIARTVIVRTSYAQPHSAYRDSLPARLCIMQHGLTFLRARAAAEDERAYGTRS